jgi:two-component system, OmpR family, KDP operon response regulator KdpE
MERGYGDAAGLGEAVSLVAVVEPDDTVRMQIVRSLRDAGLAAVEARDGLSALRATFTTNPQAVLLNPRVPGMDGSELIRLLTAACDIPVIVMMPSASAQATVRLLDGGADDVIDRSASPVELIARVRAAIRRHERAATSATAATVVQTGALVIDRGARTVTKRGKTVSLSRTEYRLLDALASRIGQVAPHRFLLSTAWGDAYVDDVHYLRVYIGYLRKKLEDGPARPVYLLNEWGLGYRLSLLPVEAAPGAPPAPETAARRTHLLTWGDPTERAESRSIGA